MTEDAEIEQEKDKVFYICYNFICIYLHFHICLTLGIYQELACKYTPDDTENLHVFGMFLLYLFVM